MDWGSGFQLFAADGLWLDEGVEELRQEKTVTSPLRVSSPSLYIDIHVCVCACVCACVRACVDGWMDGWMDGCIYCICYGRFPLYLHVRMCV